MKKMIAVLALIVAFAFSATGCFSIHVPIPQMHRTEGAQEVSAFTSIDLDVSFYKVTIRPGKTNSVAYGYYFDAPIVEVADGELRIRDQEPYNGNRYLTIGRNQAQTIDITTTNPDLLKLNVNVSVGETQIRSLNAKTMDVRQSLGKSFIQNVNADTAYIANSTGSIEFDTCNIADLSVSCSLGKIESRRLTTQALGVDCSTGSTELAGTFMGKTTVSNSLGEVIIRTTLPQSDYYCTANTSLGSIKVGDMHKSENLTSSRLTTGEQSAANTLKISNSTGSIGVSFDE